MKSNNNNKKELKLHALYNFNQAIQCKKDYQEAYYYKGIVQMDLGEYKNAKETFKLLIKINENNGINEINNLINKCEEMMNGKKNLNNNINKSKIKKSNNSTNNIINKKNNSNNIDLNIMKYNIEDKVSINHPILDNND
jgi:tetratricopeptide (TPR) repeat protein